MAKAKSSAPHTPAPAEPAETTPRAKDRDLADEYNLVVRWSDDEKSFLAEVPDWPGVRAFGPTREAALRRAEHMLGLAIATHRNAGWEPPRPASVGEGTGQFRLRLPRQLHAQLAALAARNGVSLNQFVVSLLAEGVGRTTERARATVALERMLPDAHAALAETVRQTIQESLGQDSAERSVAERKGFFDSPSEYVRVDPRTERALVHSIVKKHFGGYVKAAAPAPETQADETAATYLRGRHATAGDSTNEG